MNSAVWINGQRSDRLDAQDRGLAYGDGLFETIRISHGRPIWWDRHWARLALGATRLGISPPDAEQLRAEVNHACTGVTDGVLKLILTRGRGGRGYRPANAAATRILSLHPSPTRTAGLTAMRCALRLAVQPVLAGIKHLNRLEQVLAAQACQHAGVDEGLLFATDGRLISAVAGNVFIRREQVWWTPRIDDCGVAGVCRAWLLEQRPDCRETDLNASDLAQAEAIFVCNSVRGILPVLILDGQALPCPPELAAIQAQLETELPPLPATDCIDPA